MNQDELKEKVAAILKPYGIPFDSGVITRLIIQIREPENVEIDVIKMLMEETNELSDKIYAMRYKIMMMTNQIEDLKAKVSE